MSGSIAEIKELCKQEMNDVIAIRRQIHMYPETGFEEFETAKLVAEQLSKLGLNVKTGVNQTGVVADLDISADKKRIALRADMDALDMDEVSTKPYASKVKGKAHMCGHDSHTAMLIGAARVICKLKDKLNVNVRFIFQPNEEQLPGGAAGMIEEGVLDHVDEIYGLHVWAELFTGQFAICKGAALAQPDTFDIEISGKGGHAASPHETNDPIVAGAHFITMAQTIISRSVDPLDHAVVSITRFHGGTADNVIPEKVKIQGTVRTFTQEMREYIKQRMDDILSGAAKAFKCDYSFSFTNGFPVTRNHEKNTEKILKLLPEIAVKDDILYPYKPSLGGEDFGYYTQKIPGCFIVLGSTSRKEKIMPIAHHPEFDIDEECMVYGMMLHAAIILRDL